VDRITHAAASGAKFDNEALSSPKVQFRVNVDFTNDFEDLVSVALLLALIQDLTSESSGIAIGSQTTRGYGSIETSTVTSIRGSFHGRLANVIQTFANEQQDRPRRTGFGSTNRNAGELFEALCGGFEDNWQKARLRAIIA
jgi:CRISPR/Cas system CSM-associated protein Csm3 (group 7 of RAMP superfamily)